MVQTLPEREIRPEAGPARCVLTQDRTNATCLLRVKTCSPWPHLKEAVPVFLLSDLLGWDSPSIRGYVLYDTGCCLRRAPPSWSTGRSRRLSHRRKVKVERQTEIMVLPVRMLSRVIFMFIVGIELDVFSNREQTASVKIRCAPLGILTFVKWLGRQIGS